MSRQGATAEDDGVLSIVAMDSAEKKSFLAVAMINAINMEEIGQAHMPIVMGDEFHGIYHIDL